MKSKKTVSKASVKSAKAAPASRTKASVTTTSKAASAVAQPKFQPVAVSAPQATSDPTPILAELKNIRSLLQLDRSAPASADQVLESGVTSIRRLLSELLEKQTDWILARLVALRETAVDSPRVARALDALLDDLGAVRFRAESLDCVDPLVHTVVEERPVSDMTEGLIVETVRPGYRTGVGTVLAKACVAVSRGKAA